MTVCTTDRLSKTSSHSINILARNQLVRVACVASPRARVTFSLVRCMFLWQTTSEPHCCMPSYVFTFFFSFVRDSILTMVEKKYYGRENISFNRSNIVACRTCMYENKWPNKPQANWSIHK